LLSPEAKNAKILNVDKVQYFLRSAYEELKMVTWPSKKDTIRLTAYVIGVSFGVGLFVMFLDYVFSELLATILAA
jgi:preprotein translocase SecE subunit